MTDMHLMRLVLLLGTALVAACHYGVNDISSVPDNPTYGRDVYPLLSDHCFVCHGSPPSRGAPSTFRLDVYNATDNDKVSGAKDMAASILADVKIGKMPPAAKDGDGVGPNGLELLQRWVDQGALP